jgi:EmrB/QacA subfamily drug resistance transporter
LPRPLIALAAAVVAFAFQQTAVVPALPTVQQDFDASRAWTAWLVTGYLVASSVATPLLGKLADRHGRRRVLLWSMAAFLAGSAGAAAAPSLGFLIGCRLLQGAGGAVFPVALAIAREARPAGMGASAGVLTGAFGLGTALGFGLAGAVVDALSWRWTFALGAIGVAAGMAAVALWVPAGDRRRPGSLDLTGGILLSGGLGTLLVGLTEGGRNGWGSTWTLGGLAGAAVLLAVWARHESRVPEPLLDLRVLRDRTVLLANTGSFVMGYVVFGLYLLVPYLARDTLGASPTEVGLYMLPSALGQTLAGPLAGVAARRVGIRTVFAGGIALSAAGAAGLAVWHDSAAPVVALMTVIGVGLGLSVGLGSALVTIAAPEGDTGVAAGLHAVLRRVGGSVGGQVGAALLAGGAAGGHFTLAFTVTAAVGLVGAVLGLWLPRRAGVRTAVPDM